MSTKRDYTFSVETIREGQPRPYADSTYEYIVKSELPEGTVRMFCTHLLRICTQTKEQWKSYREDPSSYFYGYYTFQKIDENTYKYYVFKPFCD